MIRFPFTDLPNGTRRYQLPNGWFVDRAKLRGQAFFRVTVWEPGAGEEIKCNDGTSYRIAAFRGGGTSLRKALAAAGIQT